MNRIEMVMAAIEKNRSKEPQSIIKNISRFPMPQGATRIETGVVQFGDDFPGVHIRGDDAAFYANAIHTLFMSDKNDSVALNSLAGLWELLYSSNIQNQNRHKD